MLCFDWRKSGGDVCKLLESIKGHHRIMGVLYQLPKLTYIGKRSQDHNFSEKFDRRALAGESEVITS